MTNDIETRLTDLENRVSALEKQFLQTDSSAVSADKKRLQSINEFLKEKQPGTAIDIVLAIAVYHERFGGADTFSANDLLGSIRKAKLKKPANINDLINKNIAKGYFEEDAVAEDGRKRWYVTNSGSTIVDSNFKRNESNT